MSVNLDINNVIPVKRRAKDAVAILFNGKNGADVVALVKQNSEAGEDIIARNGGSYVTISYPNQGGRARKNDWVVVDSDGSVLVLDQERFDTLFAIKG